MRMHTAWACASVALGAIWMTGCAGAGPSRCAPSPSPPTTLSGDDRREPVIASDGGGGLVAAWESLTGGPVEASVRNPSGTWSAAAALSGPYARDPVVAVDPGGRAIAAWQVPLRGDTTAVQVATADDVGEWSDAFAVSTRGTHAREPQIAVAGDGTAVLAWRRDTGGDSTVIEVTERGISGLWTPPRTRSDPGLRSKRPRLAVAPNGAAVLAWEQTVEDRVIVVAVTRTSDGRWSEPRALSAGPEDAHEPDVAIGPTGAATTVWIEEAGDGAAVMATARPESGQWSPPVVIGRGSAVPYETPRPGRAETGADVASTADGRTVAVWTIVDGDHNRAQSAALRRDGLWTTPTALSDPGAAASGVQVVGLAGGLTAASWEELDGGLIRARTARLTGDGVPVTCTDLTATRTESGAVRLAGGSAPTAVFVDFNRGRVQVAPIP